MDSESRQKNGSARWSLMLVLASGAVLAAGVITLNTRILMAGGIGLAFFLGVHVIVRAIEKAK